MDHSNGSLYQLQTDFSLRCSAKGPLFCQECESCKLHHKFTLIKAWFTSLSFNNQRIFIEHLIHQSVEIATKLKGILNAFICKDYHYSTARLKYGVFGEDFDIDVTNHSLRMEEMEIMINEEYIDWFNESNEWTKKNFLLLLLQCCSQPLINCLKRYLSEQLGDTDKAQCCSISPAALTQTPLPAASTQYHANRILKCRSAPLIRSGSTMKKSCLNQKRVTSARERGVSFRKENVFHCGITDEIRPFGPPSRPISGISRASSKTVFAPISATVSRCTPMLIPDKDLNISGDDDPETDFLPGNQENCIDFIRQLPVQISKKIFGYFDENHLGLLRVVSKHWMFLADQVRSEVILKQIAKEDVMMMQATSAKVPNPVYARRVPVHIPKVNKRNQLIVNYESKHVDVEICRDEFHDIDMEDCYDGYETWKCIFEEQNVFCSSYNVFVLLNKKDTHRKIHCCTGNFLVSGSFDRKVNLYDINTGKMFRTIIGHSGSVKCVYLLEKKNLVISAGFDTSVSHNKTIISLYANEKLVASSSTDRCVKIWYLDNGRCKKTMFFDSVIRTLQITGEQLLTGKEDGLFQIWDIETADMLKSFSGHKDVITCIHSSIYHLLSGSLDGYVYLWSNVADMSYVLRSFRHPYGVLCMQVMYCRILTGCVDGKIRVWNMLNGDCIKVIRGNSKSDPITSLLVTSHRIVVNTLNCILVYHFEKGDLDYSAPRERVETNRTASFNCSERPRRSHSRALKVQYNGSPIHKTLSKNNFLLESESFKSEEMKSMESRSCYSVDQHISRIKNISSASSAGRSRNNERFLLVTKHNVCSHLERTDLNNCGAKPIVYARCRSAPAHRVVNLPKNERGFTTTSETESNIFMNKIVLPPPKRPHLKERPKTHQARRLSENNAGNPLNGLVDLKIKTFQFQLEYENLLRKGIV